MSIDLPPSSFGLEFEGDYQVFMWARDLVMRAFSGIQAVIPAGYFGRVMKALIETYVPRSLDDSAGPSILPELALTVLDEQLLYYRVKIEVIRPSIPRFYAGEVHTMVWDPFGSIRIIGVYLPVNNTTIRMAMSRTTWRDMAKAVN